MIPRQVAILSFEGPDRYASIGGLGTRVTQLARALGAAGHDVQLLFVGDPHAKPIEESDPGVTLRRWSQWISAQYPRNAYDGEAGKVHDWEVSLPPWIIDELLAPAQARGERVLVICEEWQTANVAIAIDRLARERGLRPDLTLLWNANNTYGFDRIHWPTLTRAAAITAVSKYMKFELSQWGVHALVVPNGIDGALLSGADPERTAALRAAFGDRKTCVKVGRFDPDKNWLQAIDALADVRAGGIDARLIVRGGREPYGDVVFGRARERQLGVARLEYEGSDWRELAQRLSYVDTPVVHVRAFLEEATLFALYAAADVVLANSGKEPFGLVGLEVMAAGGVTVCGATGEEYADPFVNALVCDTADGRELATYLRALFADPALADELRRNGAETAARYTWHNVLEGLDRKIAYVDAIAK
ncbi:MAG: glycosyltransferase family 4 protein [Candidatus Eremiobacteraeota bacterium]|nr:glycosyltransferase family 4 protein [Candidatus Eremiobacteraeota bacterium]MBV9408923.1 glycosyltransferase family 4 protein [Candidatus Eremiobacteraeota bacterium]